MSNGPLAGIRVLDFSSLLPGPMATLMLAEAGAEVIKVERPDRGDEMRSYAPKFGSDSVSFALLNRGKRSIAIDLKAAGAAQKLHPLIKTSDVVLEQFRPGVMERLGLGYDSLRELNPRIVYCAITGYGETGPRANVAAHDLNYVSDSGMLALTAGSDGAPVLPPALIADIAGGAYPAVVNILLALRERDRTGHGCKLDVAMADNLFPFLYWAMGNGLAAGEWPTPGGDLVTGGSPRYQIYRTSDERFVAAAPLEEKFWANFCDAIELPPEQRNDELDPGAVKARVRDIIRSHPAAHWEARFAGKDLCCTLVRDIRAALDDPHFRARGLFGRVVVAGAQSITAVPTPVAPAFRGDNIEAKYPVLGEGNAAFGIDDDRVVGA